VPAPEAPTGSRKYTVKEGDTLWGISNAYLRDSFLWPKLWKSNLYILNPDLIYPGNIIELPGPEAPQQEEMPEAAPPRQTELIETAKPAPTPPPEAAEEQAPLESEKTIEAEQEAPPAPKLSDQTLLVSSGYIITGSRAVGIVVGARDNRELIGENETAYLLPQNGSKPHVGDQYTIYRAERKIYHPKTGKFMGDLIRILGLAQVTGADPREKTLSVRILVSYDAIQKGDSFMPVSTLEEPAGGAISSTPSHNSLTGFIVEVKENRASQSQFDVVYLDRGRKDGVRSGDRFSIVREGEKTSLFSPGSGVRLPRRIIGELQVLAAQDVTSIAKIIQTTEVVLKGDLFETHSEP
jgi:LysM repeat protein